MKVKRMANTKLGMLWGKLLVALVALVLLLAPLGRALLPQASLTQIFLYSLLGLACLFFVLVVISVWLLQFWQFILRKGGTDTQWLWFPGEPRGLASLRKGDEDK